MKLYIGKKNLKRIAKYMSDNKMFDTTLHYMNLLYSANRFDGSPWTIRYSFVGFECVSQDVTIRARRTICLEKPTFFDRTNDRTLIRLPYGSNGNNSILQLYDNLRYGSMTFSFYDDNTKELNEIAYYAGKHKESSTDELVLFKEL